MKKCFLFFLTSIILFQISCKKSDSSSGKTFTITGVVLDESNNVIANATVKCESSTSVTDAEGKFTLSNVNSSSTSFSIEVNSDNYFTGYKNIENPDGGSLKTFITLIKKKILGTIPANGGEAGLPGLRVIAPAGGFTNADGSIYNGPVTVSSRYIKADDNNIANLMPGGDFMAKNNQGNIGAMITYGFVATEFKDANGKKLTPNANVKVAVTIPSNINNPISAGAKCWSYDGETWAGENDLTQNGNELFFSATTLYQNIDVFTLEFGTIEGRVVCSSTGEPVAFESVTIESTTYLNKYVVTTNENGKYKVKVAVKDGSIRFDYKVSVSDGNSVYVNDIPVNGVITAPEIKTNNCTPPPIPTPTPTPTLGSCTWTVDGVTHTATECYTTGGISDCPTNRNLDIGNTTDNGVTIYNVPTASSGTFNMVPAVTNGIYATSYQCKLHGSIYDAPTGVGAYETVSGTITKTGPTSFTFSFTCKDYYSQNPHTYVVNGSGTYVEQ